MSKKQSTVALSTTEAEYQAISEGAKEALWLKNFLTELGCHPKAPIALWNDNTGAVALAHDPLHHARTKHIDIKYHFIRDLIERRIVALKYMSTEHMPADILTKCISSSTIQAHKATLGLKPS
jgi:hypothetical protein